MYLCLCDCVFVCLSVGVLVVALGTQGHKHAPHKYDVTFLNTEKSEKFLILYFWFIIEIQKNFISFLISLYLDFRLSLRVFWFDTLNLDIVKCWHVSACVGACEEGHSGSLLHCTEAVCTLCVCVCVCFGVWFVCVWGVFVVVDDDAGALAGMWLCLVFFVCVFVLCVCFVFVCCQERLLFFVYMYLRDLSFDRSSFSLHSPPLILLFHSPSHTPQPQTTSQAVHSQSWLGIPLM